MIRHSLIPIVITLSALSLGGCSDSDKFVVMDSVVLGETPIQSIRDLADEKGLPYLLTKSSSGFPFSDYESLYVKGDLFNNPNEFFSSYRAIGAKKGNDQVVNRAMIKIKDANDLIFNHYLQSLKEKYGNYTSLNSYQNKTLYRWLLDELRVNLTFYSDSKIIIISWFKEPKDWSSK